MLLIIPIFFITQSGVYASCQVLKNSYLKRQLMSLTSVGTFGRVAGGWVTVAAGGRVPGSAEQGNVQPQLPALEERRETLHC